MLISYHLHHIELFKFHVKENLPYTGLSNLLDSRNAKSENTSLFRCYLTQDLTIALGLFISLSLDSAFCQVYFIFRLHKVISQVQVHVCLGLSPVEKRGE